MTRVLDYKKKESEKNMKSVIKTNGTVFELFLLVRFAWHRKLEERNQQNYTFDFFLFWHFPD